MTIEEKYRIHYVDSKRYYEVDLKDSLPVLDDCVPFLFRYKDKEIRRATWNRMTLEILTMLDELNPKSEQELLSLNYKWSKQKPFSKEKQTNHTPFKGIWLNTNHTSTHSMMNIQMLLEAYGVDLNDCFFLVRRHYTVEYPEVKDYVREETLKKLRWSLNYKRMSDQNIEVIQKNILYIEKVCHAIDSSYNELLIFDDYYLFSAFKAKAIEYARNKWVSAPDRMATFSRTIDYLDDYYRYAKFFEKAKTTPLPMGFIDTLKKELDYLFSSLKTEVVTSAKIFSRMAFVHRNLMEQIGELNNEEDLFAIAKFRLRKYFYFNDPFISTTQGAPLTNDEIIMAYAYGKDEFSITELGEYADKMHLKRLDNYLKFIEGCASAYVQISKNELMRKEKLGLSAWAIQQIHKEISFYIESFGPINSKTYAGYSSLPEIGQEWNKFMLAGIVRSYFSDVFQMDIDGNQYSSYDFVIKIPKKDD